MSNMSYCRFCRFENTANNMADCISAINDAIDDGTSIADFKKNLSSDYERTAFERFLKMCNDFRDVHDEWIALSNNR